MLGEIGVGKGWGPPELLLDIRFIRMRWSGLLTEGRAIITMRRVNAAVVVRVACGFALCGGLFLSPGSALALPVDVSGSVGYSFRSFDTDMSNAVSNQLLGNIYLRSYIWQPWFATVEGGLTLTQDNANVDNGENRIEMTSNIVTGDVALNVLPESRTPFRLVYQATDSRVDNTTIDNPLIRIFGEEFKSTNLDVRQSYVTPEGHRVQARFGTRTWESDRGGDYTDDVIGLEVDYRPARQRLVFRGNVESIDQSRTGRHQDNLILDLDHYYFPNDDFRVDSKASHYNLDSTFDGSTGLVDTTSTQITQASSFSFWRPLDRRWTVSAGARAYEMSGDNSVQSSKQSNLGVTAGAFYQYSKHLRFDGNATFSTGEVAGADQTFQRQHLGAFYQSDLAELRGFTYGWYGTAALENQIDPDRNLQAMLASLGHDASKIWTAGPAASLRLSLSQAINGSVGTGDASNAERLDHSVSLGWNESQGQGMTLVQLTLSDSRNFGDLSDEQQLANFQASRYQTLTHRSTLSGHLTLQTVRRHFEFGSNNGTVTSATGQVTYTQQTLFNLPRLQFNSDLRISQASTAEGRDRNEWENRLDYTIGLVDTSLSLRLMNDGNNNASLLYFRVIRRF